MFWGYFLSVGSLPNVGTDVGSNLTAGDTAAVEGRLYECVLASAFPNAIWAPQPAAVAEGLFWNINGDISGLSDSGLPVGSFNGMPTSDPALAGAGFFDGMRESARSATINAMVVQQRLPSDLPSQTVVEWYRIRAGFLQFVGSVTLANSSQFERVSAVPSGVSDLLLGDVLVAVLASAPSVGATDLTAWLRVA